MFTRKRCGAVWRQVQVQSPRWTFLRGGSPAASSRIPSSASLGLVDVGSSAMRVGLGIQKRWLKREKGRGKASMRWLLRGF